MSTDVDSSSSSDLALRAWRERRRAGLSTNSPATQVADPQEASDYADEVMVFSLVADAFRVAPIEETSETEPTKVVSVVKVGDIFWDSHYHPVLCSAVEGEMLTGVSLFDGSIDRKTNTAEHNVKVLTVNEIAQLIQMRKDFLVAEKKFNETGYTHRYKLVLEKLNWADVDLEKI